MHTITNIQNQANPFVLLKCEIRDFDNLFYPSDVRDKLSANIVRGKWCPTTESFFKIAASTWHFPYYFGENWDAFDECINDLEWVKPSNYIFAISDINKLFNEEDDEHLDTLFMLLNEAHKSWTTGENQRIAGDSTSEHIDFTVWLHMEKDVTPNKHLQRIIEDKQITIIEPGSLSGVASV